MVRKIVIVILLWVSGVIAIQRTRAPYIDEPTYAIPAYHFVTERSWGNPELEPTAQIYHGNYAPLTGIERRSYWEMPLYYVVEAGWFFLVGWGLAQLRALSLLAGIAALCLWFALLRLWTADRAAAMVSVILIAFAWPFLSACALGRPDMLGLLLGLLGLYLHERYFGSAPVLSCGASALCIFAALLCHPNAGLIWGVVFLVRYVGCFRQWTVRQFAAFAIAALVAAAGLAYWASFDPAAFRAQLLANAGYRLRSPMASALLEWKRYAVTYGFYDGTAYVISFQSLKAYSLIPLFAVVPMLWRSPSGRDRAVACRCLLLAASSAIVLALADATKFPQYGLHCTPWFAAAAGIASVAYYRNAGRALRLAAVYVGLALLAVIGAAWRNPYRNVYKPAVAALQDLDRGKELVFAPQEFIFGYKGPILYDIRLGFLSGKRPTAMAVRLEDLALISASAGPSDSLREWRLKEHLQSTLQRCRVVFHNQIYAVYDCSTPGKGPPAVKL